MTGRCAIVGDGDSIMVFKAAGLDSFSAADGNSERDTLRKVARG